MPLTRDRDRPLLLCHRRRHRGLSRSRCPATVRVRPPLRLAFVLGRPFSPSWAGAGDRGREAEAAAAASGVAEEEDNLGSLLRLVYHCPDVQQMEGAATVYPQGNYTPGYNHQSSYNKSDQHHHHQPLMTEYNLEGLPLDCL